MDEKVPLEGMNGSETLMRVNVLDRLASGQVFLGLPRSLAQQRINMRLFMGAKTGLGIQATCCVADADGVRLKALADSAPELQGCTELQGDAALVSIFPHRFNLKTVGLAMIALAAAGLPLHGFCSSLSALTFITDHSCLQEVFTALQATFEFPDNPPRMAG